MDDGYDGGLNGAGVDDGLYPITGRSGRTGNG